MAQPVSLRGRQQTHLLRRLTRVQSGLDYIYDDFREINGIRLPFKAAITSAGQKLAVTFSAYKINAGIDAAKLIKP